MTDVRLDTEYVEVLTSAIPVPAAVLDTEYVEALTSSPTRAVIVDTEYLEVLTNAFPYVANSNVYRKDGIEHDVFLLTPGGLVAQRFYQYGGMIAEDTFSRVNASALGTTETGNKAWTTHNGTIGVNGSSAYWVTNLSALMPATIDAGTPDVKLAAKITHALATGQYYGFVFRYVDANNYWIAQLNCDSNTLYFQCNVAGTTVFNMGPIAAPVANGDLWELVVRGDKAVWKVNGVPRLSALLTSAHINATRHGVWSYRTSNLRIESFKAYGVKPDTSVPTTYSEAVLKDAPVAYWRWNEASGTTVADSSGHGLDAVLVGPAYTRNVPGLVTNSSDTATQLSGHWANTPAMMGFNYSGVTLESIIKPTGSSTQHIMNRDSSGQRVWQHYWVTTGQVAWLWWGGGTIYSLATPVGSVPANVRSHIAVTYDGTTCKIYVNGVERASAAGPGGLPIGGNVPIMLGAYEGGNLPFIGVVDEFAIYNGALSPARIAAHAALIGP